MRSRKCMERINMEKEVVQYIKIKRPLIKDYALF